MSTPHKDPNGKLRGLQSLVTFTEKDLPASVLVATVMPLYRIAFKEGVWKEDLSVETVIARLEKNFFANFRGYFTFTNEEKCVAASWYEYVDINWLERNKGVKLASFANETAKKYKLLQSIWQAETMVHPEFQGQGHATSLKTKIDTDLQKIGSSNGLFVSTRMREDNNFIIKANKKLGFQRTGITMPCSLKPDTFHEYWYKIYN